MPHQLLSIASSQVPWLLPAVGIALFVHKHFLSFDGTRSKQHARVRAGARSRPPKLKRIAFKTDLNATKSQDLKDSEEEHLDAAGLRHDKLMEWFTEDEVEALHQAHANPAALISLLTGKQFATMDYDDDSHWSTDEGSDIEGVHSHILKPLELSQDIFDVSPLSAASSKQQDFFLQHSMQQQQQQQLGRTESPGQHHQGQLAQQLLLRFAGARQQPDFEQQQQQSEGQRQAAPAAAAAAPDADGRGVSDNDSFDDDGDYFDPNHYFALSPPVAAGSLSAASPGRLLPRTGAMWATSYPPRLGEGLDSDDLDDIDFEPGFVPDYEPDWDFDGPDFDPGFMPDFDDDDDDDDMLGLELGELGIGEVDLSSTAPPSTVAAPAAQI